MGQRIPPLIAFDPIDRISFVGVIGDADPYNRITVPQEVNPGGQGRPPLQSRLRFMQMRIVQPCKGGESPRKNKIPSLPSSEGSEGIFGTGNRT